MHNLPLVFPKIVARETSVYQYLKMEQEAERLHKRLNKLDRRFSQIKNKGDQFYKMIEEIENENMGDIDNFFQEEKRFMNT